MTFKVTKLIVGKGKTEGDEKAAQWTRRYYEIEVSIDDEHDIELAKASVEGLIDGWLTGSKEIEPQQGSCVQQSELDFQKLFWEQKQGEKGPFEQTSEKANGNSQLWQQLKDKLRESKGFWQHQGFKFWFDMKNDTVIDRRKVA